MFKLITDEWTGQTNLDTVLAGVTLEQITFALDRLDQNKFTSLTIENDKGESLTIGGGEGVFVVYISIFEQFFSLCCKKPIENDAAIFICIGGQEGDYDSKYVVTLHEARRAIADFINDCIDTSSSKWIET